MATTTALRAKLISLVTAAKAGTMPNAVEYLCEMERQANERRDRAAAQLIRLALVYAAQ